MWCSHSVVSLCDPLDFKPTRLPVHRDSPGKNTGMDWHDLLQGIFPTQELNWHLLCLLLYKQILYPKSHQGTQSLLQLSPFYRQENRLREIKLLAQGQNLNPGSPTPGFPGGSLVKNPPATAGDIKRHGLIPESGRSPGWGHGSPLQYSCLENPVDRGTWWATVHWVVLSQTQVK